MNATPGQPPAKREHRRGLFLRGIIAVALVAGAATAIKYGRHHVFPRRFAVVEPGQIYRSGELEAWPLERVIAERDLGTILTLLRDEPDDPDQQQERRTAEEMGVELLRVGMPGDGCAPFEDLERAAAVLADEAKRPLLVHCAAGVNRTGAVVAVWRVKYCGWDLDRALAEAAAAGYEEDRNPELREHLRRWYRQRAQQTATQAATP